MTLTKPPPFIKRRAGHLKIPSQKLGLPPASSFCRGHERRYDARRCTNRKFHSKPFWGPDHQIIKRIRPEPRGGWICGTDASFSRQGLDSCFSHYLSVLQLSP